MSEMQQSVSLPTEEQPKPPHWPHEAKQHALPLEDSIPGIPPAPVHISDDIQAAADAEPRTMCYTRRAPVDDHEVTAPKGLREDNACGWGPDAVVA